ncbi:MAG: hypothetical protein IPK85_00425 [Gemmatimonadetes bacterium]|nr:hypothetical protein [Gemmatimonadota bacterium]
MPGDRPIDGVNQLAFLQRKQSTPPRTSALFFTGTNVRAAKWNDWKFHYAYQPEPRVTEAPLMRLFNLRADPKEESDVEGRQPVGVGDVRRTHRRVQPERGPIPTRAGWGEGPVRPAATTDAVTKGDTRGADRSSLTRGDPGSGLLVAGGRPHRG